MRDVLIFYATTDGQTGRIAERLAKDIGARGFNARAIDVTSDQAANIDWENVRGVLLGASLHAGHHQKAAVEFAARYRDRLNLYPSAFFSVSLSAASRNPDEIATAVRLARELPTNAGWRPTFVECFAGRLAYTKYGWLTRLMMREIAKKEGGPTDTHHDHELTDWDMVARFATRMANDIHNAEHRRFHFAPPVPPVMPERPAAAANAETRAAGAR